MASILGSQRRRSCRSLYIAIPEIKGGLMNVTIRLKLPSRDLAPSLTRLGSEIISPSKLSQRRSRPHPKERLQAGRRKCWSHYPIGSHPARYPRAEPASGLESPESSGHEADISSTDEAAPCLSLAGQPSILPANDAHAHVERSTNLRGRREPHAVPDKTNEAKFVAQATTQAGHPAQAKWEQLWYHSLSAAYQKIACYFPHLQPGSASAIDQSISELTPDISGLKQEEQAISEEERKSPREPFALQSEGDHIRRRQHPEKATDVRQRVALSLGLPKFNEYPEQPRQTRVQQSRSESQPSKRQPKRQAAFAEKKTTKAERGVLATAPTEFHDEGYIIGSSLALKGARRILETNRGMTHDSFQKPETFIPAGGAAHRPLVVGLTKPQSARSASTMASSSETPALNKEMADNVKNNTVEAAPSDESPATPPTQKPKKEKAPKQPKPQKAAAPTAPTSPALIDLRVGHILRAVAHPNADSLYVSTIAMGDPEGTEHTQVDEETGKVVRTVCSGLNGLVPLEEMQNRKVVVVANLKPVNMRSIKSAAMVLAASPKQPEGADPHASDRVVELVSPPEDAEAGDKVFFEGWPYGEGKGPEKQLNPKKKQWEAIQPGFYTSDDLVVGFDAGQCEEVEGSAKGNLVVEGKGVCKVKTLKGAVVR